VSLGYLFLDIYPRVKSFRAMLSTGSFYLLWVIFSCLVGISYFFLTKTFAAPIQTYVGAAGTQLTVVILAALTGTTVLQSLALKIADVKIVNLQGLLDDYRRQVLEDITKRNSRIERREAFLLADRLEKLFLGREEELRTHYCQLLFFTLPDSAAEVQAKIEQDALTLVIAKFKLIALRIAIMDADRARQILENSKAA
jgi:hypothetical protein